MIVVICDDNLIRGTHRQCENVVRERESAARADGGTETARSQQRERKNRRVPTPIDERTSVRCSTEATFRK